ncbi:response regulator transcription factor [Paenibacillus sp. BR2-3]|uniref:response regulator transcription factor n=1 Tax=Paenibacillus sp. BR2-3 TaxID=3048494 RepID=UPI0039774F9F
MSKIKIGIAEDQELIRSSLQIVLNLEPDLEVIHEAGNGEQLLEQFKTEEPDLVLMDLNMPVLNGVETTRRIKQMYPHVKVIVLTTFQEMDNVVEVLRCGAEGYLLKAMNYKELAASIRLVANGGRLINDEVAKVLFHQHLTKTTDTTEATLSGYSFSQREIEVLQCLKDGLSNSDIADKLYISMGTVKNYISNIYTKLNVSNRSEAIQKIRGG